MNAEQKRAWFSVVVCGTCVIGFLVLLPIFGPWTAFGAFGFFGLTGVTPFIFRDSEPMDERDRDIARRAMLAGGMSSYGAFLLGCMGTWAINYNYLGRDQISVHILSMITGAGAITLFAARSVAILVLYGRGTEAENA